MSDLFLNSNSEGKFILDSPQAGLTDSDNYEGTLDIGKITNFGFLSLGDENSVSSIIENISDNIALLTISIEKLKQIALNITRNNHYNFHLYNYALIQSDELINKKREEFLTENPNIKDLFDKIEQYNDGDLIVDYLFNNIFDSIIFKSIKKEEIDFQTCPYNYKIQISDETSIEYLDKKIDEIIFFVALYDETFVEVSLELTSIDSIGIDLLIKKLEYLVKNTKKIKKFSLRILDNSLINISDLKQILKFIYRLEIKIFRFNGNIFNEISNNQSNEFLLSIPSSTRELCLDFFKFKNLSINQIDNIFNFLPFGIKSLVFSMCDIGDLDNEKVKVFFNKIQANIKSLSINIDSIYKLGKQGLIDLFSSIPNTVENIYLYGTYFAYIGDYKDVIDVLKSFPDSIKFAFVGNNGLKFNGELGEGSQNSLLKEELKKLSKERGIEFFGKEIREGYNPVYKKAENVSDDDSENVNIDFSLD